MVCAKIDLADGVANRKIRDTHYKYHKQMQRGKSCSEEAVIVYTVVPAGLSISHPINMP